MVILDGIVILANIYDMLLDLRFDLNSQGISLLKDINYSVGKKDCQITCPVHKSGQESHPSCGVAVQDFIRNKKQYSAGTVFCFNCSYTADFFEFVSYCFGTTQRDFGKRYIIRKYNTMDIAQRPDIKLNCERSKPGVMPYKYIDESILDNYKYTSDYLIGRKFDLNTILCYGFGLNQLNNTITIPVRDHKDGLVFVKQRFINPPPGQDKYMNESGIPKQYILYGLNIIIKLIQAINNGTCQNKKLEENYKRYGVALTEGEFNAAYLVQCGYPAVSLLGRVLFEDKDRNTIQQFELLLRNGIRRLVIWTDLDESGKEAQKKIIKQTNGQFIVKVPNQDNFPQYNDANDFPLNDLDKVKFLTI
jgi:hypothetical protein